MWYNENMETELKNRIARPSLNAIAENGLVGLIILVVLILFSPANTPIIPRDEGVFVYIGQGVLEGKIPYRDLWDHKGPLIYYIDALGLWLGRHSLWGIWLVEAALLGASLIALYRLLRTILSREAALSGLLLWVGGFAIVMGGNIVEEYAIPLTVLSLLLAIRSVRWIGLLLGVLAGLGCMLRPNEIAGPAVVLLFVLGDQFHAGAWKAAVSSVLQFGMGLTLIATGFAAYFALNRGLADFLSSVFLFNFYYISIGGNALSSFLAGAGYLVVPLLFAVAGMVAALLAWRVGLTGDQRRLLCVSATLLIGVVPLSLLSGRIYRHYYIAWLLPLSVLGSFSQLWFREARAANWWPRAACVLYWSFLVLAAVVCVRIRLVPLLAGGAPGSENQAIQSLRSLSPVESKLFIWGDETSYAVMAGRTLAGRFIYISPLLTPNFGASIEPEVLAELSANRPLIIDASGGAPGAISLSARPPFPYLEPLFSFIHQNYQLVGRLPGKDWTIWVPR